MARRVLRINLELDRIHCHDEGDGWGDAEPYLWTVFFKVDGSTVTVADDLALAGSATIATTPGSHGNLGSTDVDEGDNLTIPATIGHWETMLSPIPVAPPWDAFVEDVGGVVGVVAVLMEEDNVSDAGAEAGHGALNSAVQNALNQIVATRSLTNQDVTDGEIAQFTGSIESTVSSAVQNQQNFFENFWSWLNPDDTIGFKVWIFKHDDLADGGTVSFSHRWKNEGDWEIFGHITSTPLCPAGALDDLFSGLSTSRKMAPSGAMSEKKADKSGEREKRADRKPSERKPTFDLEALRTFRDGPYREHPGLAAWWSLAKRNTPAVVHALLEQPDLQPEARRIMEFLATMDVTRPTAIPPEVLESSEKLLRGLRHHAGSRRLSIDCSRALAVLPALRERSTAEAIELLSAVRPARHPSLAGSRGMRLRKTPAMVEFNRSGRDDGEKSGGTGDAEGQS